MKISKVLDRINYKVISGDEKNTMIREIKYDSRKVKPGDLFVCIKGLSSDGHDYAKSAYEKGCRAFLCQHEISLPPDAFLAVTSNTREALAYLSAAYYDDPGKKLKLIGITGTKGKTTTSVLIQEIFNQEGLKCGYIGSNGFIVNEKSTQMTSTTPESLVLQKYLWEMVREGMKYGVIEVSSQALENYRVSGLKFETCVFTNLSPDHIGKGEHSSFEEYMNAKKKLFCDYGCKNIVYNADDTAAKYILEGTKCNSISFSLKQENCDYVGKDIALSRTKNFLGIDFTCTHLARDTKVKMPMPGEFSAMNGLAAMAVAGCYGISPDSVAKTIENTKIDGRFEVIEGPLEGTFVVDYAHNDISFTNALSTLRKYNPSRIICVFGCIGGRSKGRRAELGKISSSLGDYSIITSQNPNFEPPEKICEEIVSFYDKSKPYEVIIDRKKAVERAVQIAEKGDIVFFAGKGHERTQLVNGVRIPYIEKETIREAFHNVEERRRTDKS